MQKKFAWTLFSIMTVAVIVLSSILISYNVRWKSGKELLDIDFEDVESAYLFHFSCATEHEEIVKLDLNDKQIYYIIEEFHRSRFERDNESYLGGADGVVFKLKDGSERKFSIIGAGLRINGKQYKCHSYLGQYIYWFGSFDEYFEYYMSELS